jgi:parallel beta-helix repeat protein
MRQTVPQRWAYCVAATLSLFAISGAAPAADYYLANKPGSGAGTKDDPFGLADLPNPDNKPTRPLTVLQPGDTLWFQGGEYAFHTGPVKEFYYKGYLRPVRSGEPGKPISFRACPGETVVLTTASGGQPVFGNHDRDYIRHEGFVVKGSIGHVGGKGAEIAYCEIIGQYVDTTDNHDGIRIEHADGAWTHHNIIHGVQGKSGNSCGIKVYKSENLIVEDNWVYDNTRGIFDKDSGINNTYRRNYLTRNREVPFHGNNQGKYMVARIYDNVMDGHVALGYLVDGTEVHDNLIRGDMLAGHWAGELWNTRLWNNIVIVQGKAVTAYNESRNPFLNVGEKKHLAYMDYNVYTAPPKYTFGAYSQGRGQTFGMDEMRSRGFEQHSQVVAGAGEVFKDERSWDLLPQWRTAGRDGDAVGPENVALVLDLTRYGPAGRTATAAAADVKVHRDLAYAKPENPQQTLNVYAPADGQRLPVVVWIHGGGWHRGDKAEVDRKPQALVDRGFVLVSINYRLFPDVTIKQIAEDVAKAIRWAHDHAQHYRGDPDRIIVMGHSAGAQLAALVCTDDRYLKAEGLTLSIIKACVPVDGDSYDVPLQIQTVEEEREASYTLTFGDPKVRKPLPTMTLVAKGKRAASYRVKFGDEPTQRELSAVTHVAQGKRIPPFLILHVADHPETKAQSQRLVQVLQTAGISAKAYPAEGRNHTTINADLGLSEDRATQEVFAFMDAVLKSGRRWLP